MTKFLKALFGILGALLIGFGLGLVVANFLMLAFTGIKYWLVVSAILVLGGFLVGLGFIKKIPKEEATKIKTMQDDKKKEEEKKLFQTKHEKGQN